MKLGIFYRNLEQGGVQRMMVNFANHMVEIGYDVTLILIMKEGQFLTLLDSRIKVVEVRNSGTFSFLKRFITLLRFEKFDILFTATMSLNIFSIIARRLSFQKTRIVISERSNTFKEFKEARFQPYKFGFFVIPVFYRFADAIIAVSEGVADDLKKVALISRKKIKVIYNPAFDATFLPQLNNSADDGELINVDIPIVMGAGRLTHQKNFKLLIDAVHIISKKRPVKLIILGEGPLKDELEQQIKTLALCDVVELQGFKLDPINWISKANVFVLSSLWEGFGNILVDALAAQTTIVSTNCKSGPIEILENGKYGYLTSSFDASEMAEKINYAIDNPFNKKHLLERAYYFEKGRIMKQYELLFKSLA